MAMTREEYKTAVLKLIEEECKKGKHSFQKISESGNDMESTVVRWCEVCGSIVIDIDYDGRTKPGAVMGMLSPSITKTLS
jgi:hypothetical protein